jgi:hypothetical protein
MISLDLLMLEFNNNNNYYIYLFVVYCLFINNCYIYLAILYIFVIACQVFVKALKLNCCIINKIIKMICFAEIALYN